MNKKTAFKKRLYNLLRQHKTTLFAIFLCLQLAIGLLIYLSFGRITANDSIFVPKEGSVAFLMNENPKFSVDFGKVSEPEKQWVRFEAKTSKNNPFEQDEKQNIFTQIAKIFQKQERYGIEMSLVGVDLSETKDAGLEEYGVEVKKVADILGTGNVKTSTELIDSGREIGNYESDQNISKQTVLNKEVADGVDLEYQILKGLGLKEEIIIRDLDAYKDSCKGTDCKLPLNEFVFDLKMDEGVELREGWFTVDGKSTSTYYFVDSKGRYLAHFLPNFALDANGAKTFDVSLDVEKGDENNYRAKVTVSLDWLLSSERVFPVRIDPSIVHDDTSDFSGGIFDRLESVAGPKIKIPTGGFSCTGGTETILGEYKLHTFTSSGTFSCSNSGNVEVLVVAGGGGGSSGGGGAGGVLYGSSFAVSQGSITVTVGSGGGIATSGGNSVFSSLTAVGGGGGGGGNTVGSNGGSGGGGGYRGKAGGTGTSGQGYSGGWGVYAAGGGGGGAAGAGGDGYGNSENYGGAGGLGVAYSITGTSIYYAGGGAGGGSSTGGCGGKPLGGTACNTSGAANTGAGGGASQSGGTAGSGGSGIVIVKYIPTISPNFFGKYTSTSLDMGSTYSDATLSWSPSGVNTGNGETPYSTTGLVAQWNLNETSGTTAVSGGTCGTSCNGTLTNMTTTGQDAATGTGWTSNNRRWGAGALMFDGTNDYATCTDANCGGTTKLDIGSRSWSISAWIQTSKLTRQIIVGKGVATGQYSYSLETGLNSDGKPSFLLYNNADGAYISTSGTKAVNDGLWHQITGTYDGTTISIYIDGLLSNSSTTKAGTQVSDSTSNFEIGARNGAGLLFQGIIDSPSIYSRALSESEVLSNYQAGNIEFQYRVSTDGSTWSDWTSDGNSASNASWNTFDNPYLYNTSDTGLVAYWPLDEASGTSLADPVGSNIGTATGTTVVSGKYSNARSFNGTSDYIRVASADYRSADSLGSVDAWIKINNLTNNQTIFQTADEATTNYFMQFRVNATTGQLAFLQKNNDTNDKLHGSTALSINVWHHVAIVSSGTSYSLYVDGTQESLTIDVGSNTGDWFADTPNRDNIMIGMDKRSTSSDYLNGYIDEVKIYNTALSATTIQSDYIQGLNTLGVYQQKAGGISLEGTNSNRLTTSLNDGLVSYWKLDEASGTSVADSAGTNTGTATGTTVVTGKYSNARSFNGTTDYIGITYPANIPIGNSAYTIESWIYPTATNSRAIVAWGAWSAGQSNGLRIESATQITNYWWNNNLIATVGTITTSAWHHVVATFDGTTRKIFYDGIMCGSDTPTGHVVPDTGNFRIGARGTAGEYFSGNLDEVKIYNIAKTADEILEEYNATSTYYTNYNIASTDLSSKNTLPLSFAGDKVGTYASAIWGESSYANYQTDANTVGIWHLDEISGSGAYIKDSSKGGLNVTPTGATYASNGKISGARSFNGSNNYITIASGFSQINTLTTSLWFKTTMTARGVLWEQLNTTPITNPSSFVPTLLIQSDGKIRAEYYTGGIGAITSTATYNDGLWHHVALVGSGTSQELFIDGISIGTRSGTLSQSWWSVSVIGSGYDSTSRSAPSNTWYYFNGQIDEARIDNIARTPDEIRQAYEVGLRTHPINVDFGATLQSGNLIANSGDTSFSVDATTQGLSDMGSNLYVGDKIIVREVSSGVEYIAQGTVNAITKATGAATVSSWDSGSTFPSGGFTIKATVFKWQTEYIPIKNRTIPTQVNATSLLTLKLTDAFGGRNIWIDDLRTSDGFLTNYIGEAITFPYSARYLQYKAIFSTWDSNVTPYISQVQLDYQVSGPTMDQIMRHGKWFNGGVKQGFWWGKPH